MTSTKPLLVGIFTALALVAVLCPSYIGLLRETVSNEAINYLCEIADHVANAVDARIEAGFQTMRTSAAVWAETPSREQELRYLKTVAEKNKFFRISVGMPGGWTYSSDGHDVRVNHLGAVRKALNGEEAISGLDISPLDGQEVFLYAVPAYKDGEIAAALIGSMYPDELRMTLGVNSFGGQGFSLIVDREGNCLVDSREDASRVQENLFRILESDGTAERGSTVSGLIDDVSANHSGVFYYHLDDGVSKIMNYIPLARENWYLMSVVPTSVAEAEALIFIRQTVYLTVGIVLLFILSCFLIFLVERRNQRDLRYLALVDQVTGGMSAQHFAREVQRMLEGVEPGRFQMIALDIDRFKLINDTYTSTEGNRVLKALHDQISSRLGASGLVSRISADNFCILMENKGREQTVDWLEQVAVDINSGNEGEDRSQPYFVSFSAGVYVIADPALDLFTIQDRANVARKNLRGRAGRLCSIMFYSELERRRLVREQELDNHREQALRDREFTIYLQPKVGLEGSVVDGAEALVRWIDPVLGMVRPDEFIPLFEQNGFVIQIDLFVFEEVCKLLRRWLDEGISPVPISVNLSKAHLLQNDFLAPFCAVFDRYDIPAQYIEIEFTETIAYEDMGTLAAAVERIHAMGFTCALDDFGAGSSSLNNLKDIPMDVLKLDRAFFAGKECGDERAKQVVSNIIQLAQKLRMRVVAEGIESPDQLACLHQLGCDTVQGYVFSKPLPVEEFERYAFHEGRPAHVVPGGTTEAEWQEMRVRQGQADFFGENSISLVLDMLPGGIFCCEDTEELRLVSYNKGFLDLLGYTKAELHTLCDDQFSRIIADEDMEMARVSVRRQMEAGPNKELEYRVKRRDGTLAWVLDRGRRVVREDGKQYYYSILLDENRTKTTQEDLMHTIERDRILLSQSGDVVFEWDLMEDRVDFSGEWSKKFGYRPQIEHAKRWAATELAVAPEDRDALRGFLAVMRTGGPLAQAELRLAVRGGGFRWCSVRAAVRDKKAVGVIHDIDNEKRQTEALTSRSQRDMLTGLYNKAVFQERAAEALREKSTSPAALLMIDVDNLKALNDRCGYLAGDVMLSSLAKALQEECSDDDVIGRVGGDEFCVLTRAVSSGEEAERLAVHLLGCLRGAMGSDGAERSSCSIGVALSPQDGMGYDTLFRHADLALYHAKLKGKSRVQCYKKFMEWTHLKSSLQSSGVRMAIGSDRKSRGQGSDLAAYVFRTLYETSETEKAIPLILEMLGRKYDVSRAYIYELSGDEQVVNRTFEWCADGVAAKQTVMQSVPVKELGEILPALREAGSFLCTDAMALEGKCREWIEKRGTRACVQRAISEGGELRGAVGFDECRDERMWDGEQLEALAFMAGIIGIFLVERQRGWTYVVKAENHEILCVNEEMRRVVPELELGMKCHELLYGVTKPCTLCPALALDDFGRGGGVVLGSRLCPKMQAQVEQVTWMGDKVYLFTNRPYEEGKT